MEKDITEKQLERFPDVAADIINGICFAGEQQIQPEEIQIVSEQVSIRERTGGYHSRIRDVLYQIIPLGICIAYIGIENQSGVDNTMPLRVMGMDYGKYVEQVRGFQNQNKNNKLSAYGRKIHDIQKLTPVITLVLNFGKPWKGPKSLLDMLDLKKRQILSKYIADYRLNLIDLSADSQLCQRFHSDFRLVVQYLQAKGNREKMKLFSQNTQQLLHPRELLDTLYALGCDDRYLTIKKETEELEKEEITMCELLDYCENKGIEKGRKLGREEGEARGIISTAFSFGASQDMVLERLCQELHISLLKAKEYMAMYE